MSVRFFTCFLLAICAPAMLSPQHTLRSLAEAALVNDPDRIKAVETLRAAEADAEAERIRRSLDGTITGTSGSDGLVSGPLGINVQGGISAAAMLPAGATVSVGTSYRYTDKEISSGDTGKADIANFNAGVKLPVFANGRPIDIRLGEAARAVAVDIPLESARESAIEQERSTVDAVIRLALSAASAHRACDLAARHAELAERDAEIARVKRSLGTISYADVSKAEKDADSARLAALEARFARDKKFRALCVSVGASEEAHIDLTSLTAPDIILDPVAERGPVVTREMGKSARDRRLAEMNRVLAGADCAPSLDVSASTALPGPISRGRQDNGSGDKGSWSASAVVTVPIPSGEASAKIRASDARLSAARQGETAAVRAAADELNDLRNAWKMACAKVELREQLLVQAMSRLRDVRSSRESETATGLDVDRAQLSADDAASALEDDRSSRLGAALDLYKLCGLDPLSLL